MKGSRCLSQQTMSCTSPAKFADSNELSSEKSDPFDETEALKTC